MGRSRRDHPKAERGCLCGRTNTHFNGCVAAPTTPSLVALVEQYLADLSTRGRRTSVSEARRGLERIVRELRVTYARDLTPPLVLGWRAARVAGGAANKTANTEVGYLRAALALAVSLGQLPQHPLAGLRSLPTGGRHQRRRTRALTDAELRALFAAADELDTETGLFRSTDPDARKAGPLPRASLLRALVYTGARWGELAAATWADLDLERGVLVLRAETTKTQRSRVVPVPAELRTALAVLRGLQAKRLKRWPRPGEPIFLSPAGRPWATGHSNFYRWLRFVFQRAGIPHQDESGRVVHVHCLRHTFATRLARTDVPIAVTQRLLGHSTPRMTLEVYAHIGDEECRKAIEGLPDLGRVGRLDSEGGARRPPSGATEC